MQSEEAVPDAGVVKRLARTERELVAATAEFTTGIKERAGPVPCLHEAQVAMEAAAAALEKQQVKPAGGLEEAALAGLIKARQNLRQFLSPNSECTSACRKFDNKQEQKLRKPPQKDKKAELAKLQEEIEKLAREEKKFSEEIAAKNGGAKLEKNDSGSKPGSKPSKKPGRVVRRRGGKVVGMAGQPRRAAGEGSGQGGRATEDGPRGRGPDRPGPRTDGCGRRQCSGQREGRERRPRARRRGEGR